MRKPTKTCDCGRPGTAHASGTNDWICDRCRDLERNERKPKRKVKPMLSGETVQTVHMVSASYERWLERRGLEKTSDLNFGSLK